MRIGVVISGMYEEYNRSICKSIEVLAEQDDVEVVIITCKYMDFDLTHVLGMEYEYQYNSSFAYADKIGFDGLIIEMASTTMFCTPERKVGFLERFDDIPHVLIGYEQSGFGGVQIDNKKGLLEGLECLFKLGVRDYVMIGGPSDNIDAISRKEAFYDFLELHGLYSGDKNYLDGDFIVDCSDKINELLDRCPETKAIICANDVLARTACKVAAKRGLVVGRDICILGYDDSRYATNDTPTLSTVRMDFGKLGETAYNMLKDVLNGRQYFNVAIPTAFIRRNSFFQEEAKKYSGVLPNFEDMISRNADIHDEKTKNAEKIYNKVGAFFSELLERKCLDDDIEVFQALLREAEDVNLLRCLDIELLADEMIVRRRALLNMDVSDDYRRFCAKCFDIVDRVIITSVYYDNEIENHRVKNTEPLRQSFFSSTFAFEHGDDTGYGQMLENMGGFGIKNAFLFIYEEFIYNLQNEDLKIPENILIKARLVNGKVKVTAASKQKIKTKNILDYIYSKLGNKTTMTVLPIYNGELLYGLLVCDLRTENYLDSGIIVGQVSAAARMLFTLKTNERLLAEYENTLQVLKSNNIKLEDLSKRDSLTGLVNRRGFELHAMSLFRKGKEDNKTLYVFYADMNNLKIINDRFGHKAGDYALKQIGMILAKLFEKKGVAGRIGGDEFACAMLSDGKDSVDKIINKVYKNFEMFNKKCMEPYLISIAMGGCVVTPDSDITFEQALEIADQSLYGEKKKRSKNIFKQESFEFEYI